MVIDWTGLWWPTALFLCSLYFTGKIWQYFLNKKIKIKRSDFGGFLLPKVNFFI
jgi:hypothetical protein